MGKDLIVFENGLVPVYETSTGEKVVDGRELWTALKSKTDFSDWAKRRFDECDAKEKADYEVFLKSEENSKGGRPSTEYIIKLATAKEMAMLERNEIGKSVRKYFISVEEKALSTFENLSPELKLFNQMFKAVAQQEVRLTKIETINAETQAKVENIKDIVALNPNNWRNDTSAIINRMASNIGGNDHIKPIREESYRLLEERYGVQLQTRLTNKRRRMADEGVCKSKRDKINQLDVISDDKKLIEGYVSIVKELAVKYGVSVKKDA